MHEGAWRLIGIWFEQEMGSHCKGFLIVIYEVNIGGMWEDENFFISKDWARSNNFNHFFFLLRWHLIYWLSTSEQEKIEEGQEAAETMAGEEKQRETEVKGEEPKELTADKYVS